MAASINVKKYGVIVTCFRTLIYGRLDTCDTKINTVGTVENIVEICVSTDEAFYTFPVMF